MSQTEYADAEQNVEKIRTTVYPYRKDSQFTVCDKHFKSAELLTCLTNNCRQRFRALCIECAKAQHDKHTLVEIRDIVPRLQKQLLERWELVERQKRDIRDGYRRLDDNLQYCIDIFKSLKGQGEIVSLRGLGQWHEIIGELKNMVLDDSKGKEHVSRLLYDFQKFVENHKLEIDDFKKLSFSQAEQQRLDAIQKQERKLKKIRKFVDDALVFSSEIDKDLQGIRKKISIKPPPKLQFNIAKICSLDPPPEQLKQAQNVDELVLALKEDTKDQAEKVDNLIRNFSKVKCLDIRGDKVKVKEKTWQRLVQMFPNLVHLREMRLTLKGEDVPEVAKLFQKLTTKLRPIDILHLKINDCKSLDIYWLYKLCNSFQLSGLWLTVTRCQLTQQMSRELLIGLKITTSMSNLPMTNLHVNLTMNKMDKAGQSETTKLFEQRCKMISKRSLQL